MAGIVSEGESGQSQDQRSDGVRLCGNLWGIMRTLFFNLEWDDATTILLCSWFCGSGIQIGTAGRNDLSLLYSVWCLSWEDVCGWGQLKWLSVSLSVSLFSPMSSAWTRMTKKPRGSSIWLGLPHSMAACERVVRSQAASLLWPSLLSNTVSLPSHSIGYKPRFKRRGTRLYLLIGQRQKPHGRKGCGGVRPRKVVE